MVVDPLTVVGLASSIVQFIDFTVKVAARIEDFQKSVQKVPYYLEDVHAQLQLLAATLPRTKERANSGNLTLETRQAVLRVVVGCQRQVQKLADLIERLSPNVNDSRWKRQKKALLSIQNEKRIRSIESCLQRYTQSLTYHEATAVGNSTDVEQSLAPNQDIIYDVPFGRDEDFVGRTDTLLELSSRIAQEPRCALVGIGGVGKSQVAIEYCYRVHTKSPLTHVFWVNANSIARFEQGYKRIARRLALPGWNGYAVDPLELMLEWFQDPKNDNWLLVLDGLDDTDTIFPSNNHPESKSLLKRSILEYIPKTYSGKMLITSRDRRIGHRLTGYDSTIRLAEPTMSEALALLRTKLLCAHVSDVNLQKLVTALSLLPLAITQAAAYINESNTDVETYIRLLCSGARPAEILDHDHWDIRRDYGSECGSSSVFRTLQISFDRLVSQHPLAADLLAFMGVLEGCAAPEFLLIENKNESSATYHTAITLLEALSLVEFDKHREVLSMHKLIHLCVRRWLRLNGSFDHWQFKAAFRLYKTFPRFSVFDWAEKGLDQWVACETLLPHALLILKGACVTKHSNDLFKKLHVLVIRYKGQRSWREPFAQEVEAICDYFNPSASEQLKWHFRACDELVALRQEQGRYQDAAHLLEEAIKFADNLPSHKSGIIVQAQLELADCKFHSGNFDEATTLLHSVKRATSENSICYHRSNEIMAMIAANTGQLDSAVLLFEKVVRWKAQELGTKHRTTLSSKRNLCVTLVKAGRFAEAEAVGLESLKRSVEIEGSSHPRTLWVKCLLAETYNCLENLPQAESLAQEVLETELKATKTPTSYSARMNLACALWLQGRFHDASMIEDEVLSLADQTLSGSDIDIIALQRLAVFGKYLHRRGRAAKSRQLLDAVTRAQEASSTEEVDVARSRRWLEDVKSCTCHALDLPIGCWQPPCKWRKRIVEGVPAYVEHESDDERPNPARTYLWTPERSQ